MSGERAGDVGRQCDVMVAYSGQERLRDSGEIPGWQAAH